MIASFYQVSRAVRMPPNLSKILYHWGLKPEVYAFAAKSKAIRISRRAFNLEELTTS
jgi:hypothetical protein